MSRLITYREKPGWPVQTWAYHAGKPREVRDSAERLLAELRESFPRASVWIDGRGVRAPKKGEEQHGRPEQQ